LRRSRPAIVVHEASKDVLDDDDDFDDDEEMLHK